MELTEIINKIIQNSYKEITIDDDYQESFQYEGERKATYIIDDLKYKESRNEVIIDKLCYLSIGGADGSEVEKVLNDTEIKRAVIIEISDAAVQLAMTRAEKLKLIGKELIVIHGDAYERLDDALELISQFISQNLINGLVVSIQAVLHELPTRSTNYNLPIFLGKLFREPSLEYCLFYSREPCEPLGWKDRVKIRIKSVDNKDFYRLVCHVRDRLNIKGTPEILSSNWLDVESVLAIESLHKLLRNNTIKRIEYELGEQLTGFKPIDVKSILESCVEGMNVSLEYIITMGFKRALAENEVEYIGHNSELLPYPQTHVEIIGSKVKRIEPKKTESIQYEEINNNILSELPKDFSNPFNNEITNEYILDWLNQFEIDEIPIILKFIENFKYLSYQKIEEYCKLLYVKISEEYDMDNSNIIFVPFGSPFKSGALISYYFRTSNRIPADKFISFDLLIQSDLAGKTLIFIDDLLASGHQALKLLSKLSSELQNTICLAVLVACEQGIELLVEKSNINIISSILLDRNDNPFHDKNQTFKSPAEREKAKDIILKYSKQETFPNPFGYAGTSLLLGFSYNTPDNTLPLFWSEGNKIRPLLKSAGPGRQTLIYNHEAD